MDQDDARSTSAGAGRRLRMPWIATGLVLWILVIAAATLLIRQRGQSTGQGGDVAGPPLELASGVRSDADGSTPRKSDSSAHAGGVDENTPAAPTTAWDPAGVKDFEFTERSGRKVTKKDLLGHPWVVAFIFTRCAGPCPRVSAQMSELQNMLKGSDVRLVTVTVDPDFDSKEVLQRYAQGYNADPNRWLYLTGDKLKTYRLISESFRMPVKELTGPEREPGYEVLHSTNVLLVNEKGVVVKKYNALNDVEMAALRRDLRPYLPIRPDTVAAVQSLDEEAIFELPSWVAALPHVNATLNATALVLLLAGLGFIRKGRVTAHRRCMLSALAASMAFLACYLVYHRALVVYTGSGSRGFAGIGWIRGVYLSILTSHTVLAAVVPVLAFRMVYLAWRERWAGHRRLGKITFPIWVYVSSTGVIIYWMLYHMSAGQGG